MGMTNWEKGNLDFLKQDSDENRKKHKNIFILVFTYNEEI